VVTQRNLRRPPIWSSASARRLRELAGPDVDTEGAVRVIATRLLLGVPGPPTNLEELGARLRVHTFVSEPMSVAGELRRDSDGFQVVYASELSPQRRRFTVAHELGHAVFMNTGPNAALSGRELERLCDMLAAEFLMPRQQFIDAANENRSIQDILRLAGIFNTSLTSTALRYAQEFYVSTFEVVEDRVVWGYGIVRRAPIAQLTLALKEAILQQLDGLTRRQAIFVHHRLHSGLWNLESVLLGKGTRGLFMLSPIETSSKEVAISNTVPSTLSPESRVLGQSTKSSRPIV
jgi:hypothetical protein